MTVKSKISNTKKKAFKNLDNLKKFIETIDDESVQRLEIEFTIKTSVAELYIPYNEPKIKGFTCTDSYISYYHKRNNDHRIELSYYFKMES